MLLYQVSTYHFYVWYKATYNPTHKIWRGYKKPHISLKKQHTKRAHKSSIDSIIINNNY